LWAVDSKPSNGLDPVDATILPGRGPLTRHLTKLRGRVCERRSKRLVFVVELAGVQAVVELAAKSV
jgi:hypothetical protein